MRSRSHSQRGVQKAAPPPTSRIAPLSAGCPGLQSPPHPPWASLHDLQTHSSRHVPQGAQHVSWLLSKGAGLPSGSQEGGAFIPPGPGRGCPPLRTSNQPLPFACDHFNHLLSRWIAYLQGAPCRGLSVSLQPHLGVPTDHTRVSPDSPAPKSCNLIAPFL